jgi:hypothetical protein
MIDEVHSAMLDNWGITIRELSDEFIWFSIVYSDRRFGHKMCLKTADSQDLSCSSQRFAAMC